MASDYNLTAKGKWRLLSLIPLDHNTVNWNIKAPESSNNIISHQLPRVGQGKVHRCHWPMSEQASHVCGPSTSSSRHCHFNAFLERTHQHPFSTSVTDTILGVLNHSVLIKVHVSLEGHFTPHKSKPWTGIREVGPIAMSLPTPTNSLLRVH
jgi:hypothetical protein